MSVCNPGSFGNHLKLLRIMPLQDYNKLNNPVWHSLNETHTPFSITYENLKCYGVNYCPFGGYVGNSGILQSLDEYVTLINNFYIVGKKPAFSKHLILVKELVCLQMVIDHKIDLKIDEQLVHLNEAYDKQVFDLVNLVQPDFFKSKTILLGDYYGIFKNDKLVSIAGERMKMNGFTEVSAIVTHPSHTGKGYARQLIAHTVNHILAQNKLPYLHVTETNVGAVALYQKLGFVVRRKISFWNFKNL